MYDLGFAVAVVVGLFTVTIIGGWLTVSTLLLGGGVSFFKASLVGFLLACVFIKSAIGTNDPWGLNELCAIGFMVILAAITTITNIAIWVVR